MSSKKRLLLLTVTNFHKLMNRQELQDSYITEIIDGMDLKDCLAMLHDFLDADLDKYSDAQLIEEVSEYYPHLIEG